MSDSTIILYDLSNALPNTSWSGNTLKARFSLNYKGLSYKTVWVEYPDISAVCKKIGAPPTAKKPDGSDHYTLPVISDSRTGRVISDSFKIAEYLDETYPDTTRPIFPPGSKALQVLFQKTWLQKAPKLLPLLVPLVHAALNPASAQYFRETREAFFKTKLEDLSPDEKRGELWEGVKSVLDEFSELLDKNGEGKLFVMGDTPSYADFTIASALLWVKIFVKPSEWDAVKEWNGGRWARLAQALEKYETVL